MTKKQQIGVIMNTIFFLILFCVSTIATDLSTCSGINRAFVFVKPNAMNPEAIELVRRKLREFKIDIVSEGSIDAATIDSNLLIDNHYGAIASKAIGKAPYDISESAAELFATTFKEDYSEVLAHGRVLNAKEACTRLGIDHHQLGDKWASLERGVSLVKFGGGFYCGRLDDIYVINGFYMAMRASYVTPPAAVRWMTVEWQPKETGLTWATFRSDVVGATDPSVAASTSIRAAILNQWRSLGLSNAPSVKENGFHASASPFEALLERMNWLKLGDFTNDPFGKELYNAGVSAANIKLWGEDPQVDETWGRGNLFDILEDLDIENCISTLMNLQKSSPLS